MRLYTQFYLKVPLFYPYSYEILWLIIEFGIDKYFFLSTLTILYLLVSINAGENSAVTQIFIHLRWFVFSLGCF